MPHNELPVVNEVVSFNGKTKNKLISIRMLGCLTFFLALLSFGRVKDAYAIVPTVVAPGYTRTNEGAQSNSLPFSPGTLAKPVYAISSFTMLRCSLAAEPASSRK